MFEDFARLAPRRLTFPHDWSWLQERYSTLRPARQLDWVFGTVRDRATHGFFEHEYIDADYRNEYANFYVKVFERLPDRCERLHFWQEEVYLGFCCIRPIAGAPVGRSAILPAKDALANTACLAPTAAHPYGQDLSVNAFPYISQDRRYGRCAHAVIWMISRYHMLKFRGPRHRMSDIVNGASTHEFERVVPSTGLTTEQIGAAFRHVGLAALHYDIEDAAFTDEQARRIITSHINSRMPIALGTPGHLTAIIGAGDDDDGFFVVSSDDEQGPYCVTRPGEWTDLFVPLPERIYLRAEEAFSVGQRQLEKILARDEAAQARETLGHDWELRCFAVEASDHKRRIRTRRELPDAVRSAHLRTGTPRWLWIIEIVDAGTEGEGPGVLGELAIDATSGEHAAWLLFANLPHLRVRWPEGREPELAAAPNDKFARYNSASALKLL